MSETGLITQEMPSFLKEVEASNVANEQLQELKSMIRPKFLKVVQKQGETSDEFTPGTVLRLPSKTVFCEKDRSRFVTPVFFWKDWCTWHVFQTGAANPVRERTSDPNSEIARKAKMIAQTKKPWTEPDPEFPTFEMEYREMLNWVFYAHPQGPDDVGEIVVVSGGGGEWKYTANFCDAVASRGNLPTYSYVYEMSVGQHKSAKTDNKWLGFNWLPAGYVNADLFKQCEELSQSLAEQKASGGIQTESNAENQEAPAPIPEDTPF